MEGSDLKVLIGLLAEVKELEMKIDSVKTARSDSVRSVMLKISPYLKKIAKEEGFFVEGVTFPEMRIVFERFRIRYLPDGSYFPLHDEGHKITEGYQVILGLWIGEGYVSQKYEPAVAGWPGGYKFKLVTPQ